MPASTKNKFNCSIENSKNIHTKNHAKQQN